MFENIMRFFRKVVKKQEQETNSKNTAKERLHLVLMQDRANVSADFLELMKQEIIEVIKKYIDVDESAIDVRLTNKENEDGTNGAPALYANIPIVNIKDEVRKNSTVITSSESDKKVKKSEDKSDKEEIKEEMHKEDKEDIKEELEVEPKDEKEEIVQAKEVEEVKEEIKEEAIEEAIDTQN